MKNLEKYAELLVRIGLNIQENQILVISSPIETAEFARLVSKKAYEAGAKEVVMDWNDEKSSRIRYDMASDEVFDIVPQWIKKFRNDYADEGAAFFNIAASDPEIMKGVEPTRLSRSDKAFGKAFEYFYSRIMSNKNAWCVASIPTKAWAEKVFPDVSSEEAVEKLWESIFKAVRVDQDDPIGAWREHQKHLNKNLEFLNGKAFKKLRYKNSIGTDVSIELPQNHIWLGGGEKHPDGYEFIANMPTEEVFTMPKANGVNGKIVSSFPLNRNGNLIKDFWFEFKEGLVVNYGAKEGLDILKEVLNIDEGAKRLGEVALVPYDSPISNQKIMFFNTLYDENASCHFALGRAYPICIKDGDSMNKEALKAAGVNTSLTHVDFMIGTKDLEIIGVTDDGEEVPVFVGGNFV